MPPPRVTIIAAVARNGVIGRDNDLIWRLRSDLRRFKALTMGKPLLMGRRTWDSIGRPLPGRRSIVLTRNPGFAHPGVETVHDWEAALRAAAGEEVMVVGGAEIYALALPQARRIHWTEVEAEPVGDTRFPDFDRSAFRVVSQETQAAGEHDDHAVRFVELERIA